MIGWFNMGPLSFRQHVYKDQTSHQNDLHPLAEKTGVGTDSPDECDDIEIKLLLIFQAPLKLSETPREVPGPTLANTDIWEM